MSSLKYCVIVLLFQCCAKLNAAAISPCGDWIPYKDEKCFKIVDDVFRTFDEALNICSLADLDHEPGLPTIQSKEEQDFLANYLFTTARKLESFWIGGKFSGNKFHWIDNTEVSFTNWDPKGVKNRSDFCVQIEEEETRRGTWIDEPCDQRNLVVCQKMQNFSLAHLQKIFLNTRKQLTDNLAVANQNIADMKHQNEEANKKIVALQTQNADANKKIADLQVHSADADKRITDNHNTLIPIGFIYVQAPNEKTPAVIWPSMKWTDVSSAYAGVFFRVEGGGADAFGKTQPENVPLVTSVDSVAAPKLVLGAKVAKVNGVSDLISTGSNGDGKVAIQIHMSGGEVRPRNMAVKVWKRTG